MQARVIKQCKAGTLQLWPYGGRVAVAKVGEMPAGVREDELARSQHKQKKLHVSQVKGCFVDAKVEKKRSQEITDTWRLRISSPLVSTQNFVQKKGTNEYVGMECSPF